MLAKLTRTLLAFVMATVMAFVFTGQMEAAAEHCARLSQEAAAAAEAVPKPNNADCHDAQGAMHHGPEAPPTPAHHETGDQRGDSHCECVAALKVCGVAASASGSTLMEPYGWSSPVPHVMASRETTPDWRPPRT